MKREETVQALLQRKVVAVLRLADGTMLPRVALALRTGGVSVIEVTLTTPGALAAIAAISQQLPDVLVGAGSVITLEQAEQSIDAGARFVVSPIFHSDMVRVAHARGVAALPGAFTPGEILRAHESGADIVKVFPAEFGGPGYLKAVRAPMPFLRLMPTGGVTPENAADWIKAGACAVGIGTALVHPEAVAHGDWLAITHAAAMVVQSVNRAG
jgi:2-dehydro-3-deoxyphosphogluconate aldolase/(4S)-4-hydroxy-2-oxoglutarate aldolase